MGDGGGEKVGADVFRPKSGGKPEYKQTSRFLEFLHWRRPKIEVRSYRGPVVFGIRDVSQGLELQSSYTLIEHAPWESMQLEILPFAMEQAGKLRGACQDGKYDEVIELLGSSRTQPPPHEDGNDTEYTSFENTVVEAMLKV